MEFVFEDNNNSTAAAGPAMRASSNHLNSSAQVLSGSSRRTRKSVPTSVDEIEISDTRPKRRKSTKSKNTYVKSTRKKKKKEFNWSWNKLGWIVCGVLFLRLIFMESGIIDYYKMDTTLNKRVHQLELIKQENIQLITEIHEIKTNPRYQKRLARKHLGVIAQNEYLVLFAKDS